MTEAEQIIIFGGGQRSPKAVFGSRLLYWADPSDLAVQWQDDARTTPAAVNAVVGSLQDKAGTLGTWYMQQAVGLSKPVLRRDASGFFYRDYDGSDDGFVSSGAINLGAYSALTVIVGLRKDTDAAGNRFLEHSVSSSAQNGSFAVAAPLQVAANFGAALRGTVAVTGNTPTTFAAPAARVVTSFFDLTKTDRDAAVQIRVNGVVQSPLSGTTGNPTGTVFGNHSLYQGRRNDASLPFLGAEYQVLIIAGIVTGSELRFIERYTGAKMGIPL